MGRGARSWPPSQSSDTQVEKEIKLLRFSGSRDTREGQVNAWDTSSKEWETFLVEYYKTVLGKTRSPFGDSLPSGFIVNVLDLVRKYKGAFHKEECALPSLLTTCPFDVKENRLAEPLRPNP